MTFKPKSEFLQVIQSRGFFADCTSIEDLDKTLSAGAIAGYIGFDATAKSLHVGSLIQIMILRWLQKTGHKPIILMGGGTTKVGDPSFRANLRPILSEKQIDDNITSIRSVFDRYLEFSELPTGALMVNNADWLDHLNYVEFLRDVGRHFSVNRMLSFDSVKSRLDREQSLSFLEFNYMILQAYDFLELFLRHDCRLQMGGADQWGNIVNGVDLARRLKNEQIFGLTSPLLTTSDGNKMGKTASGAIWLNPEMCSPYDFWQYWRNVADADVERFLLLFTEIDPDECKRLGKLDGHQINDAKIVLADSVTELAHGRKAAQAAFDTAQTVFKDRESSEGLPTLEITEDQLVDDGFPIVQAFIKSGLAGSGKEVRRLIESGGAKLNDVPVRDASLTIPARKLISAVKLSSGKKRHAMVVLRS